MPFAVAITMRTPFHGAEEEFSNVFQYGGASPTPAEATDLIAFLQTAMTPLFSQDVEFITGFAYEIGGTPAENDPIVRVDLSGVGSNQIGSDMYREVAYLVSARSSRPSALGRPVYFRKWLHTCAPLGGTESAASANGSAQISAEAKTELVGFMNSVISPLVGGIEYVMQSVNGGIAQTPAFAADYMEHRQFPEGRKENGS